MKRFLRSSISCSFLSLSLINIFFCSAQSDPPKSPCPPALPPRATRTCTLPHANTTNTVGEAELAALQADNEELRQQTSRLEVELGEMAERMERVCEEKESLGKKVFELQKHVQAASSPSHSRVATPTKSRGTPPPMTERFVMLHKIYI